MRIRSWAVTLALVVALIFPGAPAPADETCNSPYPTRLIKGPKDYVHVWTLGIDV